MIKHYTFYQWFSLTPVPFIIIFYRVITPILFDNVYGTSAEWLMSISGLGFIFGPSIYLVIASIYFLKQGKPKGVSILILLLNSLWLLFFGGMLFAVMFLGLRA